MSSTAMMERRLLTQASRKGKDPWPFNERVDVEDSSEFTTCTGVSSDQHHSVMYSCLEDMGIRQIATHHFVLQGRKTDAWI